MSQMNEENGDVTQGQDAEPVVDGNAEGTSNDGGQQSGHPAWKEILDILPDEFHPLVTPKLADWDAGVQTRFQNLQSQYEPYKTFLENDVDPDYLNQAIGLAAAIEQDPERVYKALAEAYGYDQGVADTTASGTDTEEVDSDDPYAAKLAEHERMMTQMAETFLAEQNAREEQETAAALDQYMSALHEAYDPSGGFDDNFILTQLAQGIDGEVAVKNFQETVKRFAGGSAPQGTAGSSAPPVMGSSGGLPTNRTDPRNLSNADTEKLVAEMLRAANEE